MPPLSTAEGRRHFAALGAVHVYAFSRDGVSIRRSLTLEEEVEATQALLQLSPSDSEGMDALQRLRELLLAREVTAYMTGHGQPCNTVVVYGDAHLEGRRIEKAFEPYGFLPHIQSVIFPGALDYK